MRKSAVSGLFYPDDPHQLYSNISNYFSNVKSMDNPVFIQGVIAPHAGYTFSGLTAAYSFNFIQPSNYKHIIILGPSHYSRFVGASISEDDGYSTPLGNVLVDRAKVESLTKQSPYINHYPQAHVKEHSIEVEIPFLQVKSKSSFKIIPIIMSQCNSEVVESIANAIVKECSKEETLIIISSDFSHFFSAKEAESMDYKAINLITKRDIAGLRKESSKRNIQMCGEKPIEVLLKICDAWGIKKSQKLHYTHSGHVMGDYTRVVGYASMIFY